MQAAAVSNLVLDTINTNLKARSFRTHSNFESFSEVRKRILNILNCISIVDPRAFYSLSDVGQDDLQTLRALIENSYSLYSGCLPPVFGADKQLLDLFALTDLPKGLGTLQKPFNQAFFFFPKNYFVDSDGDTIDYCFVDLYGRKTEQSMYDHNYINRFFSTKTKFSFSENFNNTTEKHILFTTVHKNTRVSFSRFGLTEDGLISYGKTCLPDPFLDSFVKILLQVIFYLQIQPDADITNKEIQSDNAIGFGKKLTRKDRQRNSMSDFIWLDLPENKKVYNRSNTSSPIQAESTRDVSTHWRRGHWRNQPIGEKRQDSKLIWIRPSLINPV